MHRTAYRLMTGFCLALTFLAALISGEAATIAQEVSSQTSNSAAKRPNVVFAFADDWGRYASAYAKLEPGGPSDIIQTPNFDRVAREGVLFTRAYVNAPSCTPCRSALLSGQYFWRTGMGAILQGAVWDSTIPSYPLLLQASGYHIGHTYKVWSPGTPANAPYGAEATAYNGAGRRFNSFSQNASAAADPEIGKQALFDEVRGNFQSFLDARPGDAPFCYWFGPTNCHRKWVKGSGLALWGIDPDDLQGKMPPHLPDVPEIRQDFADYLGEAIAFDKALGVLMAQLEEIGELDNTILVVSGDHGIPGFPRGKCNLYDFGVGVSLAIRWGDRVPGGRVADDFVNLMDLAPTFLDAAGETPPEVMTGRSLLPTLLSDRSGLVDPTRDYVVVGRERHVAEARTGNLPYPQRALRTAEFLYVRNFKSDRWPMGLAPGFGLPSSDPIPTWDELEFETGIALRDMDASPTKAWLFTHRNDPGNEEFVDIAFGRRPAEELYDLRSDPRQMHNVADDDRYAAARKEMSDRLMKVLNETGDPRVVGAGDAFDGPPWVDARNPRK